MTCNKCPLTLLCLAEKLYARLCFNCNQVIITTTPWLIGIQTESPCYYLNANVCAHGHTFNKVYRYNVHGSCPLCDVNGKYKHYVDISTIIA